MFPRGRNRGADAALSALCGTEVRSRGPESTKHRGCMRGCSAYGRRSAAQPRAAASWRRYSRALGSAGSSFAEDADDGAAEEVAGVLGGRRRRSSAAGPADRELAEQAVQGRLALAAVEGGEGLGADARPEPAGSRAAMPAAAKSLGVRLDRLQRLLLRPALEPGAAERDGDVGAARLQFGGLAQRELVACLQQLVGLARAAASRRTARPWPAARRRRTRRRPCRRGRPSPPGSPARRSARPAPGWRRRRPWPAARGRRGSPRPLPAPGSAPGRARTTRPRSRPRPGSSWRARRRRGRRSLRLRRWPCGARLAGGDAWPPVAACAAGPAALALSGGRGHTRGGEMSNVDTARSAYEAFGQRRPGRPAGVVRRGRRLGHLGRAAARRRGQGPRRDHRRTSPRSPTTGPRSASSPRSSSTPASTWSSAAPSARATTRAASRPPSCTCSRSTRTARPCAASSSPTAPRRRSCWR